MCLVHAVQFPERGSVLVGSSPNFVLEVSARGIQRLGARQGTGFLFTFDLRAKCPDFVLEVSARGEHDLGARQGTGFLFTVGFLKDGVSRDTVRKLCAGCER